MKGGDPCRADDQRTYVAPYRAAYGAEIMADCARIEAAMADLRGALDNIRAMLLPDRTVPRREKPEVENHPVNADGSY